MAISWWPIGKKLGNLHYRQQPGHQCATHPSFHPRSTTILEEIKIRMVSTIRLSQSGTHSTWYSVCQQCNLAPKLPTISDAFRYVTKLQDCQDDAFPTCDKTVIVKPVLEGGRERE